MNTASVIEAGDFIKARGTTCCGIVTRVGHAGTQRIPGYWIATATGREDFIDRAAAVLVAKSDAWWERLAQEHGHG